MTSTRHREAGVGWLRDRSASTRRRLAQYFGRHLLPIRDPDRTAREPTPPRRGHRLPVRVRRVRPPERGGLSAALRARALGGARPRARARTCSSATGVAGRAAGDGGLPAPGFPGRRPARWTRRWRSSARTSLELRQRAVRVKDGTLLAELQIVFVMIDGEGRPTPDPAGDRRRSSAAACRRGRAKLVRHDVGRRHPGRRRARRRPGAPAGARLPAGPLDVGTPGGDADGLAAHRTGPARVRAVGRAGRRLLDGDVCGRPGAPPRPDADRAGGRRRTVDGRLHRLRDAAPSPRSGRGPDPRGHAGRGRHARRAARRARR